jgi:hypothetical protein
MANPNPPSAASLMYGNTDYARPTQSAPPPAARPSTPSVLSTAALMYGSTTPSPPQPAAAAAPERVVQTAPTVAAAPVPDEPISIPQQDESGGPSAADLLFDLPQDGVQYGELSIERPEAVPLDLPAEMAAAALPGQLDQVKAAFVSAGIGSTLANALVEQGKEVFRNGPMPADQAAAMEVSTMAELNRKWGSKAPAKIAAAQSVIAEAAQSWPGIVEYLNASGLGNDPKLIARLAARAERRPGKR